jgi:hypothetical protein
MADGQLDWLDLLETHRPDYLSEARDAARKLLETRESITVNDVRAICPPPADVDPRVMGALFRCKDFEATGEFVTSARSTCHHRPIQKFTLSSFYRVHRALGRAA